ncbi:MAG TPA: sigma-70 family RNA polymerase sigma factor [Actinomycetota bacterium]
MNEAVAAPVDAGVTFELFFEQERRRLWKVMYLLTGDGHEADEISQEAMVRVLERWDRVRAMASPAGYLYRVAFNLHRRSRRRRRLIARESPHEGSLDPAATVAARVDVMRALAGLSMEQRQALVLVDFMDMSSEEAGRLLAIDPSSVRSRLQRARGVLRERLEEPDD